MEQGLKRITDLFVEGCEIYLGDDDEQKPVVMWVNKLNSFEVDEVNRDASVRRAERIAELTDDSPEVRGIRAQVDLWSDDELRQAIVATQDDEIMLESFQNLQTQKDWMELEDYVRRAPMLMEDDSVKPGDPRFETIQEKTAEYTRRLQEENNRVVQERMDDLAGIDRDVLMRSFMEGWRARATTEEWQTAKRQTELYLAARACRGTFQLTM